MENNQYTVQYSVVGSAEYTLLATANYTGDVASRLVTITEDTTGVLASGVDSIRFNLTEAAMNCVINEIDVHGSPTNKRVSRHACFNRCLSIGLSQ